MKIYLLATKTSFSDFLSECLKEDTLEVNCSDKVITSQLQDSIVVINLLQQRNNIEQELDIILQSSCSKIILLENALDVYLNSKNLPPYSVYLQLEPKNEICSKLLDVENKLVNSGKEHVVFRISDIYGPSNKESITNKLINTKLENTKHDFIYEGDVVQAIEIALRPEVNGLFDIASGETICLRNLVDIIQKMSDKYINIEWKRKKQEIYFNCENFKFFGWQPLVNIETGLKTIYLSRRS